MPFDPRHQFRALSPPASLLLVHGAGSGPWVYDDWPAAFPTLRVEAVDLQEGLSVEQASMGAYAERVVEAARNLPGPVAVCGWSMGGLVVLLTAEAVQPHSVVLLEASAPAEVQGFDPDVQPVDGAFDPEAEYGAFPSGIPARPESLLARAERKRGLSVPSLPCPSLVIAGADFPVERGRSLAGLYGSELVEFPELGHFDMVLAAAPRRAVATFLGVQTDR
jgi:pimeloyl-ACP methyl ester carboxylesterase